MPKFDENGKFIKQSIEERFFPKILKTKTCWLWTGIKSKQGYGLLKSGSVRFHAHRISWELHIGNIPVGICVLHKCDNPPCVNPSHLFLGTRADNAADKVSKNRQPRGETNGMAKLTKSEVLRIFKLRKKGMTQRAIAEKIGCKQTQISRILIGKRWKHAFPEETREPGIGNRKIPAQKLNEIFDLRNHGFSQAKIGASFGVSQSQISKILLGKSQKITH